MRCNYMMLGIVGLLVLCTGLAHGAAYYSPSAIVPNTAGTHIYVAEHTYPQIDEIDVSTRAVTRTLTLTDAPLGLVMSSDDSTLYVTAGEANGKVHIIDVSSWQITTSVDVGHTPMAPVLSADGNTLLVCNRFNNTMSVIDLSGPTVTDTVTLVRQPVAMALSVSQGKLVVANHLPSGAANTGFTACDVSIVDASTYAVVNIPLLNGATAARGICVSPDGSYAYVTHLIGRYQLPTSHLERGWVWRNAISIIDIAGETLVNTVLVDETEMGAANPWGITCSSDGSYLCVTHAGSHELSVINRLGMHNRLGSLPYTGGFSDTAADVPNDLGFLSDLRERVALEGKGPRSVAIIGGNAYVANYYSDSIDIVSMASGSMFTSIELGPQDAMTQERLGEHYFNDAAEGTFQKWLSCASCHPDIRADGLNWDLANDGYGSTRNAKSMLKSHETGKTMITGIRPDAPTAVRAGFKFIQFAIRDDVDAQAIDAYLSSVQAVPSPYLVNGQLSADAQAGKALFEARCASCHSGANYTDSNYITKGQPGDKTYVVGTGRAGGEYLDTPTLQEVWRTAPYLQDGRAATIEEVLTTYNPSNQHGTTSDLNGTEIAQLAEYVLSLPEPPGDPGATPGTLFYGR
jgi:YVTN family beta-propeller protein